MLIVDKVAYKLNDTPFTGHSVKGVFLI